MARPTVHRTGSRRLLADKTGFDPRHRVSSVIFRVVPRPLWSSRPASVRASRSLAKDHFILRQLLPPSDRVRPRTLLSAISELLSVETSSVRRSFRRNDFSPSTYSRPGGARSGESLYPARLSVSTYFYRAVRNSLRLRYPLIYHRTGGTFSDGNA